MAIKIPSKSILDRPILNISNDNIYPEIEYSKKNNKMKYVSIYSNSVKCADNTSVNTSYTIVGETDTNYENSIILYSGNISDYENFNDIKIENDSLKLLGVYNVYDSDNSTVRSDLKQFLFKTTIKKENVDIDYSTISISYTINQNILQTGIYPLNSLNRDAKNFLENQSVREVIEEDKHYTVYFANNEDEALAFLGDKNTGEFVFYPRLTVQYCSIVNRDDDFDIYFYQSFYAKRTNAMGHYIGDLLNLYLDFSFDIYAKEIVSTSNNINENAKYSLPDNELLATQTKIDDTDIYTQINNSITKEFGKGKHSVDLTCLYMEYKDINGQVVYSGKDGNTIAIGDEIEPYYYTDSEGDLPIGTYPNGDPLQFIVYSSEIESDDGVFIKNHIKAIEKINANKMSLPEYLNFTGLDANGNMEGQLAFDGNIVAYAVGTPIITITTASDGTQSETIGYNYCNAFNYEYYGFEKPTTLYTYRNETEAKQNPFWYNIPTPVLINPFFVEPNIVIPKTYKGKPVTKILSNAFIGSEKCFGEVGSDRSRMEFQPNADKFSSFEFGENIDVIDKSAFCGTAYGVLLPIMSNINKTFGGNTYEKEYNMPNVKEIKTYAFERDFGHQSIASFKGSKDLVIDDSAFFDCKYALYEFSSKNISIGEIQNTNGLVFKNTVESVNLKSNAMSFSNSSCGLVFYHSPTANIILNITSQKTATEITIYTDNNIVKSFDWASKNYTVTFKSLSEWES